MHLYTETVFTITFREFVTAQLPYSRQEEQLNVLTHSMGVLLLYVLWI